MRCFFVYRVNSLCSRRSYPQALRLRANKIDLSTIEIYRVNDYSEDLNEGGASGYVSYGPAGR